MDPHSSTAFGKPVFDAFREAAESFSDKPAIIGDRAEISFAELQAEAESLARYLGGEVTDTVTGLQIRDPIDFMIAYFAVSLCDARLVLVDPRATGRERADLLGDLAVDLLLVRDGETEVAVNGRIFETAAGRAFRLGPVGPSVVRNPHAVYAPSDFVVHTTSGSTARPKGIALSAANVLARIASWRDSTRLSADDTVLCMLTLSHCHGIEILMLPALCTGCTVVAPSPEAISARRIVNQIARYRVSLISSLPWFYTLMTEAIAPEKCDLRSMRMMISASARIDPSAAEAFRKKFGFQLRQAYGLSEIGAICLDRDALDETIVGIPLDGVEVRIVPDGDDPDEGELISRGPGLARGYVNAPEAQADMFRDGWLWSKDIVRREPHGYRIVGRRSQFINVGGNNVSPSEVEDAVTRFEGVREAVIRGMPQGVSEALCI